MAYPARIKLDELERLAGLQCTQEEVAAYFRVSVIAVEKCLRVKKEFREAWVRGQNDGKISLRRAQLNAAMNGNPTMLIWMGKQLLGQRDVVAAEISGPGGGPIETSDVTPAELFRSRIAGIASRIGTGSAVSKPDPQAV